MKPRIELAKARDFSELIGDTFTFIKQNFKPLLACFFTFCGIFLVASTVALVMQQIRITQTLNSINGYGTETATTFSSFRYIGLDYFIAMGFLFLTSTMITITVLCYISQYKNKGNVPPTVGEVWAYIRYFFFRSLGATIILTVLIMIGLVFCLVPGFWLLPILSLVLPVMILENTSFGYAFNHVFRLIKDYWWLTFGAIVVVYIITYIGSFIVVLPTTAATTITMLIHIKDGVHFSTGLMVAGVILKELSYILYIIPVITIALCYYNLTEVKEGTSMLARINTFGSTDAADHSATPEEY